MYMKPLVEPYTACFYETCPIRKKQTFFFLERGAWRKGIRLLMAFGSHLQELIFISSVTFIEYWGRRHAERTHTISPFCWPRSQIARRKLVSPLPSALQKCRTQHIRIRNINFRNSIWLFPVLCLFETIMWVTVLYKGHPQIFLILFFTQLFCGGSPSLLGCSLQKPEWPREFNNALRTWWIWTSKKWNQEKSVSICTN